MKLTAELSLYPLRNEFRPVIKRYLAELQRNPNVRVQTNAVSTQLFGDYNEVMALIQEATRTIFDMDGGAVLNAKFLNTDRSESNYHRP